MTHIVKYLDTSPSELLQQLQKLYFAVRAHSYCNNCKNPFRGLQLQQCTANYLLSDNIFASVHARRFLEIATIADLILVSINITYSPFPLASKRRVSTWHLAAIPTSAKTCGGSAYPVHLRGNVWIGGVLTVKHAMSGLSHLKIR